MRWITGIFILTTIESYSQETKFVPKKGREFNEEYYVLASDNDVKEGTYVKYMNGFGGIAVLESGSYKGGKKVGMWEYYYKVSASPFGKVNRNNSLKMKGQYVNDRKNGVWGSFYLDTIANFVSSKKFGKKQRPDSLNINIEQKDLRPRWVGQYLNDKRVGEWIGFDFDGNIKQRYNFSRSVLIFDSSIEDSLNYNKDRPALFIGGSDYFADFLFYEFDFESGTKEIRKDSSSVVFQFSIDTNRKVGDIKILQSNARTSMEEEGLRLVKLFDDNWLPAMRDSQPVKSNYKLEFRIIRTVSGVKTNYKFDYQLLRE
ncbi:MAG TPA: energy transducer TonB [Chryseolinea sp.]|nr:energy transducer TonB [Chryseolinea sp.]